jgi:hypothetical protein
MFRGSRSVRVGRGWGGEGKRRQQGWLAALSFERRCGVSEGRFVGGCGRIGSDQTVAGSLLIVAVDLIAVAGLEAQHEFVQEVEDLNRALVGQGR